MKKRTLFPLLIALVFLFAPQGANGQVTVELGPRIGIDLGDVEEIFVGAEGRITSSALPVVINPGLDYYFVDSGIDGYDQSLLAIDIDALYKFGVANQSFTPYAGGGLGIVRSSVSIDAGTAGTIDGSSTEVGLNIVGGAEFETGSLKPFVQAKINVGGDFTLFNLMGGLLFSL